MHVYIFSTSGYDFIAVLNKEINQFLGVDNPRIQPIIGRQHHTTQPCMVARIIEKRADWYKMLPSLQQSFATRLNSSTGLTPYEMMFGRKPILPMELKYSPRDDISEAQAKHQAVEIMGMENMYTPRDDIGNESSETAIRQIMITQQMPLVSPSRFVSRVHESREQISVMHEAHISTSHAGFKEMKAIVSQRFYWPGMMMDIHRFIATCKKCKREVRH